jgi:hypothetical protein
MSDIPRHPGQLRCSVGKAGGETCNRIGHAVSDVGQDVVQTVFGYGCTRRVYQRGRFPFTVACRSQPAPRFLGLIGQRQKAGWGASSCIWLECCLGSASQLPV